MASRPVRINPATVWQVPESFRNIYAHAVELPSPTRTLFISGQVGVSANGAIVPDFVGQLEQTMTNVEALISASGMTLANVVKITYLLTRTEDLAALCETRRRRWAMSEPPAVTVIVVAALARPDYLVEIEVTAAVC